MSFFFFLCFNLLSTYIWEDPLEEGMATHSSQYSCLENLQGWRNLVVCSP